MIFFFKETIELHKSILSYGEPTTIDFIFLSSSSSFLFFIIFNPTFINIYQSSIIKTHKPIKIKNKTSIKHSNSLIKPLNPYTAIIFIDSSLSKTIYSDHHHFHQQQQTHMSKKNEFILLSSNWFFNFFFKKPRENRIKNKRKEENNRLQHHLQVVPSRHLSISLSQTNTLLWICIENNNETNLVLVGSFLNY